MARKTTASIFILFFFLISGDVFSATPNWNAIKSAYQKYLKSPTDENAKKVYSLLPRDGSHSYLKDTHRTREIIRKETGTIEFIYAHLSVLEGQFNGGKRSSVELAFRLVSISDGAFSEDLSNILISIICKNPKIFLEELKTNRIYLPDLKYLLHFNKRNVECLERIRDKNLQAIRDECIETMRENTP